MGEEAKKKICLVEDDANIREIYGLKLAQSGYQVLTAQNGAEGFDLISREKPDLALVDINMPVMNGFELIEKMQEDEQLMKTPVVILTNYDSQDIVAKASKLPNQFYLVKSLYTPQKVVDIVDEVLCQR